MNTHGHLILGIHAGHNASALIGNEQGIFYAVQEERLTGEKNYWGWPQKAIEACLAQANATPDQIGKVVFGARQLFFRYHNRKDVLHAYQRQDSLSGKVRQRVLMPLVRRWKKDYGQKEALERLQQMGFKAQQVAFYEHHTCHAATAYYGLRQNPNEDYLVLTADGSGEMLCATVRVMGPNGKDQVLATTNWHNSLGAMYAWTTFRMGFYPLEHEYKLMGMAPYAERKYADEVKNIYHRYLGLDASGLAFKIKTHRRTSNLSRHLFKQLDGKRFDAICGGLQLFSEELLSQWVANAVKASGVKKVLAAGGVFMNVKANQLMANVPEVEYFEAFPSCGDETLPFGAYYMQAAKDFGAEKVQGLKHYYLGDDVADEAVQQALEKEEGLKYHKPDNMAEMVAELLEQGHPVARCAGGMEFGARALGNRSILADPSNSDVVRVINRMVKKRDFWMPFAPMMKADQAHRYIENPKQLHSPYMMMTFATKDNHKELIAAVHNADLTCRAQLLAQEQNPEMYAILNAFEQKTGRAVVLNTSYNLHGFPIARTPEEGLYILQNSGLKYMQLGSYLVEKV